jgi:hypothetical protein
MNLRAIVTSLRLTAVLCVSLLGGCHHSPAPDYPSPNDPAIEETDLYEYTELPEGTESSESSEGADDSDAGDEG